MNKNLNSASKIYLATLWGKIVGFIAFLHFPHPKVKNMKKVSRLVVLPDYQGVGIGLALLNWATKRYHDKGFRVSITTSHPAVNKSMREPWKLVRQGRVEKLGVTTKLRDLSDTLTVQRHTCSWEYRP